MCCYLFQQENVSSKPIVEVAQLSEAEKSETVLEKKINMVEYSIETRQKLPDPTHEDGVNNISKETDNNISREAAGQTNKEINSAREVNSRFDHVDELEVDIVDTQPNTRNENIEITDDIHDSEEPTNKSYDHWAELRKCAEQLQTQSSEYLAELKTGVKYVREKRENIEKTCCCNEGKDKETEEQIKCTTEENETKLTNAHSSKRTRKESKSELVAENNNKQSQKTLTKTDLDQNKSKFKSDEVNMEQPTNSFTSKKVKDNSHCSNLGEVTLASHNALNSINETDLNNVQVKQQISADEEEYVAVKLSDCSSAGKEILPNFDDAYFSIRSNRKSCRDSDDKCIDIVEVDKVDGEGMAALHDSGIRNEKVGRNFSFSRASKVATTESIESTYQGPNNPSTSSCFSTVSGKSPI